MISADVWSEIFLYLNPNQYYLSMVNRKFRDAWSIRISKETRICKCRHCVRRKCCSLNVTAPLYVLFSNRCWNGDDNTGAFDGSMVLFLEHELGWSPQDYIFILAKRAIMCKDLDSLRFLTINRYFHKGKFDFKGVSGKDLCSTAASVGNLEILCYLRNELACAWDANDMTLEANENDHGHILQYVRATMGCSDYHGVIRKAFKYGCGLPIPT